jgi:ribosomal protein L37E
VTDTVCPSCGKSALSVATRCPRCGYAFDARYDRHIDPKPRRQRVPGGLLIVLAVLTVAAANFLWKSGRVSLHDQTRAPRADSQATKVEPQPLSQPGVSPPAPVVSRPTVPAAAESVVTRPPVTAPAERVVSRPTQPALPAIGERRFASTWINVRANRSNRSRVVRVLRPGEAVQVDSLGQGWYRIVSGEIGYADRRLLAVSPPRPAP